VARVGLTLYSVRESCAADFEGTLREVAEIGYEGVEPFDLHGHEPTEVGAWLQSSRSSRAAGTQTSRRSSRSLKGAIIHVAPQAAAR
jgi:hypothetical protein